jgi:hypothetical protein
LTRTSPFRNTGRDIDCVPKQILAPAKADAAIDSRPDLEALALGQVLIVPKQAPLNFDGSPHRKQRFRELGHNRVSYSLDYVSLEFSNGEANIIIVAVEQQEAGSIAKAVEVIGRPDDVGEKYRNPCFMAAKLFIDFRPSLEEVVDCVFADIHIAINTSASCVNLTL